MTASRDDIVAAARALVGTPYVAHGRVPGPQGGTDCLGVLILIARACGFKPPEFDVNNYSLQPDGTMLHLLDEHCVRLPRAEMGGGDIVAVSWGDPTARHVGVVVPHRTYAGHLAIVHAYPKARAVREHRLELGGFMGFVAAYRFQGVA